MFECRVLWQSYISSSSEDLGEDHSGQTVSAVVQCGYSKFQHSILVLHRAQIQQAANTENKDRRYTELLVTPNVCCDYFIEQTCLRFLHSMSSENPRKACQVFLLTHH